MLSGAHPRQLGAAAFAFTAASGSFFDYISLGANKFLSGGSVADSIVDISVVSGSQKRR